MKEVEATVVALEPGHAWVSLAAEAGCGSCGSAAACGRGLTGTGKQHRVPNRIGARIGDRLILRVAKGAVLQAAFVSYLLPLAAIVAGAAFGTGLAGDFGSVIGALIGLATGWAMLAPIERRLSSTEKPVLDVSFKPGATIFDRKREP